MKLFECQSCKNPVYFSDTICVACGHQLGYLPHAFTVTALAPVADGGFAALFDEDRYKRCANAAFGGCNWLIPHASKATLCMACQHNRTVPDLTVPENLPLWQKIELAKHHLFYSLTRWRLPIPDQIEDPEGGLVFDFVSDVVKPDGTVQQLTTGHAEGLITINIAEADDAERERRRTSMNEPYRTLLGHFRHEIGHYYWDRLVRDSEHLPRFRQLFGDETHPYADALKAYYDQGAPADWQGSFISAYASAHPWEDFAETWAHYVHIVDALETVRAFGISMRPRISDDSLDVSPTGSSYTAAKIEDLVSSWVPVTLAVNSINRSLGLPDLYPFVVSPPVVEKLRFVHDVIQAAGQRTNEASVAPGRPTSGPQSWVRNLVRWPKMSRVSGN